MNPQRTLIPLCPQRLRQAWRSAAGLSAGLLVAVLAAAPVIAQPTATTSPAASRLGGEAPTAQPCPAELPAGSRCLRGRDYLGAWQWIALPPQWNQRLLLQVDDGPLLGDSGGGPISSLAAPTGTSPWRPAAAWLRAGYAWASSTPRQGGLEVLSAGEDAERTRQAVVAELGEPERTLLLGQGFGAAVALRMAERYTTPDFHPRKPMRGKRPYDALLLVNGWLAGPRALDEWLDLRVVYQAQCRNDPAPAEADYPLWRGLPLGAQTSPSAIAQAQQQFAERFAQCTGSGKPLAQRSAAQKRALANLTGVLKLPEAALLPRLQFARVQMHDLVWRKFKGSNPFGNEGVRYQGSDDDAALNAQVARYKAEPSALARLEADIKPSGLLNLPLLSLHGVGATSAVVEQVTELQDGLLKAGTLANLLATYFEDGATHQSAISQPPSDPLLLAAAQTSLDWAARGTRPIADDLLQQCRRLADARSCNLLPDYSVAQLPTRIAARPVRNITGSTARSPSDGAAPAQPLSAQPQNGGPTTATSVPNTGSATGPATGQTTGQTTGPTTGPATWPQPLPTALPDTPNPAGDAFGTGGPPASR